MLKTITSLDGAIAWLRNSFLYIRAKQNPIYYGVPMDENNRPIPVDQWLEDLLKDNIQQLCSESIINQDTTSDGASLLQSTKFGEILSRC